METENFVEKTLANIQEAISNTHDGKSTEVLKRLYDNILQNNNYCYACKQLLPNNCFGIENRKQINLRTYCKSCIKARNKKYYEANKTKRWHYQKKSKPVENNILDALEINKNI